MSLSDKQNKNTKKDHFGRVGVLMGGYSSERDVSLKSGRAIYKSLQSQGFNAIPLDIVQKDEKAIMSFIKDFDLDLAFIALHGHLGEDGAIQSMLERLGVAYTGSGITASKKAINKIVTQKLLQEKGIMVPSHIVLSRDQSFSEKDILEKVGEFPVVIKPACEGSSVGVNIVQKFENLRKSLEIAWKYGEEVIVEKYIKGRELTVGILDNEPLAVIEIVPKHKFFNYTAKYQKGQTNYIVPAHIPQSISMQIQEIALKAHSVLYCAHFSRVDFILSENLDPYVLEINTIPGFTSTSLLPKAAKQNGINFDQLCYKLMELANGEKKTKN